MEYQSQPATAAQTKGLILNVMRYSVHDGPGIRTTVFLKGCPLKCWWCHNPESQKAQPQVMYAKDRCIGCGDCVKACGTGALTWSDGRPLRQATLCVDCGECAEGCMTEARRFVGKWVTVEELMRQLRRDVVFFDESQGGVTFSGGEPLMQPDFLEAALTACHVEGIHTTVDTCGYARAEVVARISSKADLFLFDLKMVDSERHTRYTGVGNAEILENLTALLRSGKRVIVRIPVIPGVNDDDENMQRSVEVLARSGVQNVDLLAYHVTGIDKCQRLGLEYGLPETKPPSMERMQQLSQQFRREGFTVRIGG